MLLTSRSLGQQTNTEKVFDGYVPLELIFTSLGSLNADCGHDIFMHGSKQPPSLCTACYL